MSARKKQPAQPELPATEQERPRESLDTVLRGLAQRLLSAAQLAQEVLDPARKPVVERDQFNAVQRAVDEARIVVLQFETLIAAIAYQSGHQRDLEAMHAKALAEIASDLRAMAESADDPEAVRQGIIKALEKAAKESSK